MEKINDQEGDLKSAIEIAMESVGIEEKDTKNKTAEPKNSNEQEIMKDSEFSIIQELKNKLDNTWQHLQRSYLKFCELENQEYVVNIDKLHIKLSEATNIIEDLASNDIYSNMLNGVTTELSKFGGEVKQLKDFVKRAFIESLTEEASLLAEDDSKKFDSEKFIEDFLKEFLSVMRYPVLTNMLRTEQINRVYLKKMKSNLDEFDESDKSFNQNIEKYSIICKELLDTLEKIGVIFDKIEFLQPLSELLKKRFEQNFGYPLIFSNEKLKKDIIEEGNLLKNNLLNSNEAPLVDRISDVSQWGFECKKVPSLSRDTKGWYCRGDEWKA